MSKIFSELFLQFFAEFKVKHEVCIYMPFNPSSGWCVRQPIRFGNDKNLPTIIMNVSELTLDFKCQATDDSGVNVKTIPEFTVRVTPFSYISVPCNNNISIAPQKPKENTSSISFLFIFTEKKPQVMKKPVTKRGKVQTNATHSSSSSSCSSSDSGDESSSSSSSSSSVAKYEKSQIDLLDIEVKRLIGINEDIGKNITNLGDSLNSRLAQQDESLDRIEDSVTQGFVEMQGFFEEKFDHKLLEDKIDENKEAINNLGNEFLQVHHCVKKVLAIVEKSQKTKELELHVSQLRDLTTTEFIKNK